MIDFSNKTKQKLTLEKNAALLKAISHPVRLCILALLMRDGKSNVTDMQCCIEVSQSTVSQHLSKLKAAGIVISERKGTEIIYSIKDARVTEIIEILLR